MMTSNIRHKIGVTNWQAVGRCEWFSGVQGRSDHVGELGIKTREAKGLVKLPFFVHGDWKKIWPWCRTVLEWIRKTLTFFITLEP